MEKSAPAKAVVKTMRILECLSHQRSIGITELARKVSVGARGLQMNKSTVYRFLASLRDLGFVRQDAESGHYSLTLKLFEIGMRVRERLELWREAEPVLKDIARLTGETTHLAILEDDNLVYLGKIESTKTLRVSMMSRVGQTAPTHCTGVGRRSWPIFPRRTWTGSSPGRSSFAIREGPSRAGLISTGSSPPSAARGLPSTTRSMRQACAAWPPRYGTTRGPCAPR